MSVDVQDIVRRFGSTDALKGVSLSVREGEFLALLGPSGSGKTTLLRVLAGLEGSDSGTVHIAGRDMTGVPARERNIGVVFQHYALFRHMTVFDNVAFGLRVRRQRPSSAEIAARVRRLLELVQVPELERRYPDQISGGQRQRVALARALAIEPRLLLLDEPFGALDALVRKDVRRWVRGLHDSLGITTILVTHDQEEAMEMADRIAVMESGRIMQLDTVGALLRNPASAFVAGFVGEAARLPCRVQNGAAHFDPLPVPPLQVALPDGPAIAFLRPSEIVARHGSGAATVRLCRTEGDGPARLIVQAGDVMLDALAQPDETFARGESCRLSIRGGHVFAESGERAQGVPLDETVAG
ncbi:sulfate/molybdate ABC transporter ATP-binding protein [Pararoseomonas indoligenes]|uniref:Sulfate/molybdate ABC transporter ATP-binding protein n=1 Tax=Roseomonas indoligenes TaxID=2820811 RepID=A0A940SAB7_9PROT|nr:sulfate/molybdate ABC transporter ATP-binding protein [Pararoseomonas indoligenes]MBP0496198.1 sulfate/molybdate ABC transporter ATP-binding protein [Pararoseomonas indoligenes]